MGGYVSEPGPGHKQAAIPVPVVDKNLAGDREKPHGVIVAGKTSGRQKNAW